MQQRASAIQPPAELLERVAARTYAELAAVTADLPTLLTRAQPPRRPAPEPPDKKAVNTLACVTAPVTSTFAAGMVTLAMTDGGGGGFPVRDLIFPVTMLALFSVPLAAALLAVLLQTWLGKRWQAVLARAACQAQAGRNPGTRHLSARAGSFRRPVTVTGAPPKQYQAVVPVSGGRGPGRRWERPNLW